MKVDVEFCLYGGIVTKPTPGMSMFSVREVRKSLACEPQTGCGWRDSLSNWQLGQSQASVKAVTFKLEKYWPDTNIMWSYLEITALYGEIIMFAFLVLLCFHSWRSSAPLCILSPLKTWLFPALFLRRQRAAAFYFYLKVSVLILNFFVFRQKLHLAENQDLPKNSGPWHVQL